MNYNKKSIKAREKKVGAKKTRKKQKAKTVSFYMVIIILLCMVSLIGGLGIGVFRGILASAPSVDEINVEPTGFITTIYDSDGKPMEELSDYTSNRIEVKYEEIPENLQDAFIAIEDERFKDHKGIDIKGMIRALFANLASGGISEGASTITQQLIKNNVFDVGTGETTFFAKVERKLKEQYLALQVEKELGKEEILTHYLNTINLGQGTLGVGAAARTYFDKTVTDLNLAECAVLAAITKSPTNYNPVDNPEKNQERRDRVLSNMLEQELITTEEYNEALADNVYERIQQVSDENEDDGIYSYFVDALIKQIITDLQAELGYSQTQIYKLLYSGGLSIYSTQDTGLQKIVDSVVQNENNYPSSSGYALTYRLSLLKEDGTTVNYSEYDVVSYMKKNGNKNASLIYSSKDKAKEDVEKFRASVVEETDKVTGETYSVVIQPQASVTLIDQNTGEVKALSGGRGKKTANLSLNRATGTTRQPGSTFKVLSTFLPALDTKGNTLATVHDDAPYNYVGTDRQVRNWWGTSYYRGYCTMREAITDSLNVITAKTMEEVTPQLGYDYLMKLGFTTLVENRVDENGKVHSDIVQPLALGGITDGITNLELTAAYAAIANEGVYIAPKLYTKIVDHDGNVLYENESEEKRVMKETTAWLLTNAMKDVVTKGTGTAARLSTGMTAAGKTGTTSNKYDFWFSGYTPYYTASVWMGYDINTKFNGDSYPKVIWKKIMDKIVREENLKDKGFPSCDNIVSRTICTESGLLAVDGVCNAVKDNKCTRTEYFEKGTQPTKKCNIHTKITVCKQSGLPAGQYCPETEKEEVVYLIKEEKYDVTTWDTPYILPKDFQEKVCDKHDENSWIKDMLTPSTGTESETTPAAENQSSDGVSNIPFVPWGD